MDNFSTDERPSFIVQNITPFYHVCSDINLTWGPREVKDLTWEDPMLIKKSANLKNSLRQGTLRQLNEKEYEKTQQLQYEKEKKQLLREQKNKNEYKKIKADDRELMADTFELDKARRKFGDEIDNTGTANHPMSYVTAFEIAQNIANERGDLLTAEEFSSMVESNPNIVPALLAQTRQAETTENPKSVYYAVPMGEGNTTTGVIKSSMKNFNRDARMNSDFGEVEEKTSYIMDAIGYDEQAMVSQQESVDVDFDMDVDVNDEDFAETIVIEADK
jgi:hypothetical protein